jgi:diguanylate cyclase (GGDEF)-like protein
MVRRVGALAWLLTAVLAAAMLPVWPPTGELGAAGWPIVGVAMGLQGVAIALRGRLSLRWSLWVTLANIALLGLLALMSAHDSRYTILIAVPVVFLGASQTPRRVGVGLVLAAVAEWSAALAGGLSTAAVATAAVNVIIWTVLALLALVWTAGVRWQRLALRHEREHANHLALHDPITSLGNRRKLLSDLEEVVAAGQPAVLALFDLNGFKAYNDSFGHPAGDALLARLSAKLVSRAEGVATAYRMGGDEFCLLARGGREVGGDAGGASPRGALDLLALGRVALSEHGQGFMITAAAGAASLPSEAGDPAEALRLADGRMYADKHERRGRAATDGAEMLLAILQERDPALSEHSSAVAQLAGRIGSRLAIVEPDRSHLVRAAQLHDIGKLAIPDAVLGKPGPLDESEWEFMRRHTLIGERVTSLSADLEPGGGV